MATSKQKLGEWGELRVVKLCACPKCKRTKTLKQLPKNFKCADIICDFCGFLGQVKTMNVRDVSSLPTQVLGAAWAPQKERMDSGIYFPLYLVLKAPTEHAIFYLPIDFQTPDLFSVRKPLSGKAQRKGWQGFLYMLNNVPDGAFVRLVLSPNK